MRRTPAIVLFGSLLLGCVKGTPDSVGEPPPTADGGDGDGGDGDPVFQGGSIDIAGCSYRVTTKLGAEAPAPSAPTFGANPTPRHVHLGIASDPRTSVVFTWRAGEETTRAAQLRYARGADLTADQLTETRDGFTVLYQGGFSTIPEDRVRVHEVHLCGLTADTAYSYQVGGGTAWSPVYTFRTAPDIVADPSAEVALAFVGDSRDGYDIWGQLAAQIKTRAPDLILFSGDAVTFGQLQPEWDSFFEKGGELLATVPMVSAHGNHDLNSINYFTQLAMPGDEENYSIDYGFAHVTVLNDSPVDNAALTGSIKQFLDSDLTAHAAARWKLVMHHRPQWSASANHGSNELLQQEWGPIIDQHRVDMVLSGHDHDYERSKPLRAGAAVGSPSAGTIYVVSGGAGAELYENGSGFWTEKSEKSHGATLLRIRRDQLTMEAFRPDGSALDAMSITKSN